MHNKLPPRSSVTSFSIKMYNETVEMLAWWRKQQRSTGSQVIRSTKQAGIVWVQNDSGEDLDQFDVLGLDIPLISPDDNLPEFSKQVTFSGIMPDSDEHRGRFCVLQQPLGVDKIGRAVVSGVTPARVYINDTADEYADVTTNEATRLDSGPFGARVLWKPTGTGEQLCTVRLGDSNWQRPFECKAAMPTSGSVVASQQVTAHPLDANGDIDTAEDREFEVYDERGEFRAKAYVSSEDRGSKGVARWSHDSQKWFIVTLQPHALRISGTAGANVFGSDTTQFTLSGTPVVMNPSGGLIMEDLTAANLIKNPRALFFASGDVINAEWNEDVPQWEVVHPGRPQVHRITGLAAAAVYYNTTEFTLSGSPDIINPINAISDEVYTATNLIKNPYALTFPISGTVFAEYNDTDSQWEAVGPNDGTNQQAAWLQFTASADFLTGGAITIDARTYLDGQAPAVDITSILNPDNLTGNDNATGIALINRNVSPPTYTAVSVSPVAENVITDFQVTGLTLQTKNRDISIMPRGAESGWNTEHTGNDCP
jgi:hypothetical protein